jgi:hypothetical protein
VTSLAICSAGDIGPVLLMPYVQSISDVLSSHLGWHRARLKFMARFTSTVLAMTTTNLRRIAIALKAGVEAESNYRRIQRFLSEYDLDAVALGRLLVHLLPQGPPTKSSWIAPNGTSARRPSIFW